VRRIAVVIGAVACLVLSACQATIRVGVDVRGDGRGAVTVSAHLDHDAAASYASYVRTADLVKAGWTVTGPTPGAGGSVDFTASKPFANPAAAKAVVAELSGPTGPFRDLTIVRHSSFFQTTTLFQGTVDLTCGINCFSDPQLQQALGGNGIDPSTLQSDSGVLLNRIFQFEVAVRLPGHVQTSNAPSLVGNDAVWKATLGQKAALLASARAWNVTHIGATILVGLLVFVGLALVGLRARQRRRRPNVAARRRR
jgi:hypothetical protein